MSKILEIMLISFFKINVKLSQLLYFVVLVAVTGDFEEGRCYRNRIAWVFFLLQSLSPQETSKFNSEKHQQRNSLRHCRFHRNLKASVEHDIRKTFVTIRHYFPFIFFLHKTFFPLIIVLIIVLIIFATLRRIHGGTIPLFSLNFRRQCAE